MSAGRPALDADLAAALAVLREAFDPCRVEVVSVRCHATPAVQPPPPAAPTAPEAAQGSLLDLDGRR